MLVVGFPEGREGFAKLEAAVGDFAAGNVILFTRNMGPARATWELVRDVRALVEGGTGIVPFVCVDQEGGTVVRLRNGVTPVPGAMAQAAAVGGGSFSLADVRGLGRLVGSELLALGINWNLAPVADVNVNPSNPVIGVRSYGEDPRKVADLAAAFAAGLGDAGVLAAAKHFPGHGDTAVDSHLGMPLVPHDMRRLEAVELPPFRRLIAEGVAAVMTSHVRFPAVEPDELPATLSRRVIQGLLRERLGFKGLVCTDCMEMKAVSGLMPEAAVQAVKAGVDLIDIRHTLELQRASARAILEAVLSGEIPESRIDESWARIAAAKARLKAPPASWEESESLLATAASLDFSRRLSRASISLIAPGEGFPLAPGSLYVDVEPANLTGAEDGSGGRGAVADSLRALSGTGGAPEVGVLSLPLDPEPAAVAAVLAEAAGRDVAVGTYDAFRHPGQAELVRALAAAAERGGKRFAVMSMRSPYDLRLFPEIEARGAAISCAYEYTPLSARSAAEFMLGLAPAAGRCPVSASARDHA